MFLQVGFGRSNKFDGGEFEAGGMIIIAFSRIDRLVDSSREGKRETTYPRFSKREIISPTRPRWWKF